MKKYKISTTFLAAMSLCAGTAWANPAAMDNIPDAGALNANIEQERDWAPNDYEPQVRVDVGNKDVSHDEVKIMVKEVRLRVDDKAIKAEELQAALQDRMQGEMSFADLQSLADQVTDYLRQQGYMTALAYLPTQEIVDGVVTMEILAGHYGATTYDNTSELATSRADGFTHPSRTGKLIRRQDMDSLLLIMNDIPGVKAHAFLYPGQETGYADVKYKLTTTERQGGYVYIDNYGSRYSGRWRIGANYHYNNLSHVGDQISLGYLQSFNSGIHNYNIRYTLPVGNFGTFVGLEFFRTDYDLGEPYDQMGAYGMSQGWRLSTRSSLKRTRDNNWFFLTEISQESLTDRYENPSYNLQKHNNIFRFGFDGDNRTSRSASSYKLMHSIGHLVLDSRDAMLADTFATEGTWQKTALDVYHIQRLHDRWNLHLSLRAQYPWSNLDSSQKMYIGGYNAVRAFPQGESGGDKGILGTVELRYQTGCPQVQLAAFWDGGWVQYNREPMAYEKDRTRSLQGLGLGVIWRSPDSKSYARLDYAYPLNNRYSRSYGKKIDGTFWFRFIQQF